MFGRVRKEDIEVIDGDSIHDLQGTRDPRIGSEGAIKYRLIGWDSPEVRGREKRSDYELQWGEDAKAYLQQKINAARTLQIRPQIFGRWRTQLGDRLARAYIDGRDAKDIMIEARMGIEWYGKTPRPRWDQMKR